MAGIERLRQRAMRGCAWFSALVLFGTVTAVGMLLSVWAIPAVVVAVLLAVSVVGALQLRQDARLREKGFLRLMALTFRQIPFLGGSNEAAEPAVRNQLGDGAADTRSGSEKRLAAGDRDRH